MIKNTLKQIEEEILQNSTEVYIGSGSDLVINTKHAIGIAKSSIIKVLQHLVEMEKKRKKPLELVNEGTEYELPRSCYCVSREGECMNCVIYEYNSAKQDTIDYLKSEIANLSTNIDKNK